jgi:hypothetical protein
MYACNTLDVMYGSSQVAVKSSHLVISGRGWGGIRQTDPRNRVSSFFALVLWASINETKINELEDLPPIVLYHAEIVESSTLLLRYMRPEASLLRIAVTIRGELN